ncbi:MAG: hypothetical protein QXU73_02805 [Thermoplasmata archaeon]
MTYDDEDLEVARMSGGDITSWRIPSAVREAEVKKLEAEGKVAEAWKSKHVTLEDRGGFEGKSFLYLILLLVVVGVIVMAIALV